MEKIYVGEYIRTKNGYIAKIKGQAFNPAISDIFKLDVDYRDADDDLSCRIDPRNIKKHSFNVIDLIREMDLINKKIVIEVYRPEGTYVKFIKLGDGSIITNDKEIKSILTKEQYSSMEYIPC